MQELTDTQNERDDRNIAIDRVGVKALRFPLEVKEKAGSNQRTVATVALAVDLPKEFKGTHMSRFVEVLSAHGNCLDVRELHKVPCEMLEVLNASRAHVEFDFAFFRSKAAPVTKKEGLLDYQVNMELITKEDL